MRLHYLPGSAALAPHATLAVIGVPYELVRVERTDGRPTAEYLALNPWGRVPTLEDGDHVLTESAAICLHLAERHPEARLVPPAGTRERSELYRWLVWLTNTVQMTQMRYFYPERYGTEGVGERAEADLAEHYDLVDAHLDGREWLVGTSGRSPTSSSSCSRAGAATSSRPRGSARTCARTGCGRWRSPG